ncbi:hypothetical protein WJX74_001774 [Apatococcus lobatus]|uniref:Uncharacterized protein n=1 Tax=Apatococcus lobatus TaxID=904363 RepID=A0AAW1QMA2_9CHLO
MDSNIDLDGTWKDCERHVEQLTQLVRQILSGDQGAQQAAPALLERLDLLKASCRLARGQSELLSQREKVAVRTVQHQAAASVTQMAQNPTSVRLAQATGRQQTYLPGVLQQGSHQLQVLTPANNIVLTGGNLPGQASMQAVQTCTVDASQLSPHLSSMNSPQSVSYILPAATIGSAQMAPLRPSQAAGTRARMMQVHQQQQQSQTSTSPASTLPGQAALPGVSNAALGSLSYLQSSSLLHSSLGNPQLQRHAATLGAGRAQSPFGVPTSTIPNASGNLASPTNRHPATPTEQLHAAKRMRKAAPGNSFAQLADTTCESAALGEAQPNSPAVPAGPAADVTPQTAPGGNEVPVGVDVKPIDKEQALRMLAGAALSPFAAAQEGPHSAGHSALRASVGSSPVHAAAASAAG